MTCLCTINDTVYHGAISPASTQCATVYNHTVKIWDAHTGAHAYNIVDTCRITRCSYSHSGQLLSTLSDDNTAKIWDLLTGSCLRTIPHSYGVSCCVFSPDDLHLVTGTWNRVLTVWNVCTGGRVRTIQRCHWRSCIMSCCFSFDGLLLASASHVTIDIWDPTTGASRCTLRGHDNDIYDCKFSPRDATVLATTSVDRTIKLWNVRTAVCYRTLAGHEQTVNSCAFFPDGAFLATTSHDTTTRVWDVYTGVCVHTIYHSMGFKYGDVSLDGLLFVGTNDAGYVWRVTCVYKNINVLLMVLAGHRCRRLRLPPEIWAWMDI